MKFNEKLLELRKQKGWSQEELGNQLNVSRQTISKWEMASTTPELENLVMLSKIFDISIDELVANDKKSSDEKELKNINIKKKRKIIWIIIIIIFILCIICTDLLYRSQILRNTNMQNIIITSNIAHIGGKLEIQTYEDKDGVIEERKTIIYKFTEPQKNETDNINPYVSEEKIIKIQEFESHKLLKETYINLENAKENISNEVIEIDYKNNNYKVLNNYKFDSYFANIINTEFNSMFNIMDKYGYGSFYEVLKLENKIFQDNQFYYVENDKLNSIFRKDYITLKVDKENNWIKLVKKEYDKNKKSNSIEKTYVASDIVSKKDVELPNLTNFTLLNN